MRRLLIIILSLYCINTSAQPSYFNTEEFWSKLVYNTSTVNLNTLQPDTAIIVVSNRKKTTGKLRFMSEYPDETQLSYFVVYSYSGQWHVKPVADIKTAINMIPDKTKDWVVYTEGMGKIFTSELYRGMNMAAQYNVNVIMLDYPSITTTKSGLGNYLFAIKQARASYQYFTPVLANIKELYTNKKMGSGKMSLFFHSMGNNLMRSLIKKGNLNIINDKKWVDNLIFNAACVPQSRHHLWMDKINFANNIYVHYNPEDFVLGVAHLLSKRKQLGEKIKHPMSKKAIYINFNNIVDENHSSFLNIHKHTTVLPIVWQHYNTLLHGDTAPIKSGNNYWPSTYNDIGWDLLVNQSTE